jgi:hypothetical protein
MRSVFAGEPFKYLEGLELGDLQGAPALQHSCPRHMILGLIHGTLWYTDDIGNYKAPLVTVANYTLFHDEAVNFHAKRDDMADDTDAINNAIPSCGNTWTSSDPYKI